MPGSQSTDNYQFRSLLCLQLQAAHAQLKMDERMMTQKWLRTALLHGRFSTILVEAIARTMYSRAGPRS